MKNDNGFYNHFTQSADSGITSLGKLFVQIENNFLLNVIKKYSQNEHIKILEIGPGLGFFAENCKRIGFNYFAIEANHIMVNELEGKGIDIVQGYVPPIPGDDKYNVIFMNQVLEHMKCRDQAIELINSCKDHLLDDGLLVISSPDIEFQKEDFFNVDYTHDYPTSKRRLEQIFIDNNLEIKYSTLYSSFFRGRFMISLLTFFVRFFYSLGLFHLFFGKKAYIGKASLLPSCLIVGKYSKHSPIKLLP